MIMKKSLGIIAFFIAVSIFVSPLHAFAEEGSECSVAKRETILTPVKDAGKATGKAGGSVGHHVKKGSVSVWNNAKNAAIKTGGFFKGLWDKTMGKKEKS